MNRRDAPLAKLRAMLLVGLIIGAVAGPSPLGPSPTRAQEARTTSAPPTVGAAGLGGEPQAADTSAGDTAAAGTAAGGRSGADGSTEAAAANAAAAPTRRPPGGPASDAWLSRFRRIFFYEPHAPRLVPRDFWPVSLDDLEAALLRESTPKQPGEERPQMSSAVYVARFESGALVSDADTSMFDLTYRDDAPGKLSLGAMNLALEGASASAGSQSPRLVTSAEGTVHAIVYQDCRLRFGWSRRGKIGPDGSYQFDLQIPPSGRTRFVLGVPAGVELDSLDGVVTAYPSPPQEARGVAGETALSWYGIEAGGLTRLRLVVRPSSTDSSEPLAIRQMGFDYAAAPEGLQWSARVVVDLPRTQSLPPMRIPGAGRITSVRLNAQGVRWKETTEAGETRVQIIDPPLSSEPVASPATLEIAGIAPLGSAAEGSGPETLLPQIEFLSRRSWMAMAESEALLRVAPPLRLAQLMDDEGWVIDQLAAGEGASAERVYRLSGPPGATLPSLRLAVADPWPETTAVLRLAVLPDVLRARWEAAIQIDAEGPRPLQFEFQPGWQIESIFLRSSGRIIDVPDGEDSGHLTVWPEAADAVDGVLRIQFTGHRTALREGDLETVPPTWFTRLRGAVVRCVAAVVPPADFDWAAGMSLRGRRLDADELTASFAEMIGPVSSDTLLFDTDDGLTPALRLRQPPPQFHADLHLDVRVEGDELVERLRVVCRLPSGNGPRLRVRLGPRGGRPPMRWSVADSHSGGAASASFEAELVGENAGEGEVWELAPGGSTRDQWVVVGQRRYSLRSHSFAGDAGDQPFGLPLPTIPLSQVAQAASSRATVSIGSRLTLVGTKGPVLRVPSLPADDALSLTAGTSPEESAAENGEEGWSLRYDASSDASVTLRRGSSPPPPPVVWEERVEVLAGVGGGDEIRASYRVDHGQTLELRFDEAMVLSSIDGSDPDAVVASAGRLRIPAPHDGEWIHVVWSRSAGDEWPLRRFHAPTIDCAAVILQRDWQLWTTPDTRAIAASVAAEPPAWMHQDTNAVATIISPGQSVWLLPSGVAWAAGGALALFVVGLSGWLLGLAPWLVVAALASFAMMALLVPVWTTAISAFLLMPLAAAGILASSGRVRPEPLSQLSGLSGSRSSSGRSRRPPSPADRPSRGGSGQLASTRSGSSQWGILWVVATIALSAASHAGQPPSPVWPQAVPTPAAGQAASSSSSPGESTVRRPADAVRAASGAGAASGAEGADEPKRRSAIGGTGDPGGDRGVAGQAKGAGEDQTEPAFPVMIPLKEDGQLAGDKVYVPKAFYDSLFEARPSDADVGEMEFLSAAYQVHVTPSADRRDADAVTVEAVWRVEIDTTARPVRLPIDPASLDRLEIVVDSVPNEVRPRVDGEGLLIRPPRTGVNILRATLSPQVEINSVGGASGFEMRIPPVAQTTLTVTSDSSLSAVNLATCFGRIDGAESGTRVTASLGPVPDLVLQWQRGSALPSASGDVDRRWWVHAGAEHVSRELEIAIGDVGRAGVIVELAGHGDAEPIITTGDWTLDGSRTYESRSLLRLISRVDSPGPIRLLWVDSPGVSDGGVIRLPDVRPAGFGGEIATSVAAHVPEGWAVDPVEAEEDAAQLDVADFFELWQGYRGAARDAWWYDDVTEVELRLVPPASRSATASEVQDLVVARGHLRVAYRAMVRAGTRDARPLRLVLPLEMRIERLELNGESAAAVVLPSSAEARELLLPRGSASHAMEIHLTGIVPVGEDGEFSPPRVRLSGVAVDSSRYRMSRGEGLQVSQLEPPPNIAGAGEPLDYDLLSGTAPLQSWMLSAGEAPTATHLGGRFRVSEASSQFAATSLTTLRWQDGLWTMEVTIDVEDFDDSAAFLTIEVPSRWIEGLDVQPAAKWSSQPANDPAFQLIRILPKDPRVALFAPLAPLASLPAADGEGDLRIRITSTLESGAEGGVSVPDIRLLGEGPRRRFFSAPRRLTSTPIEWRTSARLSEPPTELQDIAPPAESHTFYEVAGDSFSATLRPADGSADAARCTLSDVALFPHEPGSTLALMRWDLLPGDHDRVQFSLPPTARVIGVWTAGTPTNVRPESDPDASGGAKFEVPVGLSRLAQQIVMLVALRKGAEDDQLPLPQLVGVPVTTTWAARYDASLGIDESGTADGPSSDGAEARVAPLSLEALLRAERMLSAADRAEGEWESEDAAAYRRAVAAATIEALDASVDNVAERPTAEKRRWLHPWFARLRQLGWPGITSLEEAAAENPAPAEGGSPEWAAVDSWAPRFLQRVLGSESDAALADSETSGSRRWVPPSSWSASRWMTVPGAVDRLPESMIPSTVVPGDPEVRSLRVGWVGLLTFGVVAISLWLTGASWLMHPTVWLVMLALFSIPLLPVPVAVAIAALGLASPILGRR